MAQPALRDIYHAFARQAEKARAAFAVTPVGPDCVQPHQNNREWCVIYLFDAWARCCRRLVIGSAYAAPVMASGATVTPVAPSEPAALVTVRKGFGRGGHSWEPQWGSPGDAVQAAVYLRISNLGQVSAALGATPNPAEDVRVVRNFIAHRNSRTASDLRTLGMRLKAPTGQRADDLLTMPSPPSPTLFDWWVSDLKLVVAAAVF